nr:hypothetical protein [Herminiimonas sp. CN]
MNPLSHPDFPAPPASPELRAAALAHFEFNAINLALDAIWRFAGMPYGCCSVGIVISLTCGSM